MQLIEVFLSEAVLVSAVRLSVVEQLPLGIHHEDVSTTELDQQVWLEPKPILIAVPDHAPDSYLALLGALARTFHSGEMIGALLQATTPEELCDLLAMHSRHSHN